MQASQADASEVSGSSDTGREAAERGIACQLLSVLYDGSPLVRAELAAALARLAAGHTVLFQVASHHTMHVLPQPLSCFGAASGLAALHAILSQRLMIGWLQLSVLAYSKAQARITPLPPS